MFQVMFVNTFNITLNKKVLQQKSRIIQYGDKKGF